MRTRWNFSKVERALILVALIGIVLCLYLLAFENHQQKDIDPSLALGSVRSKENDTRQKQKGSFLWDELKKDQGIFVGDSVYTGNSARVQIDLQAGSSVQIGEHSLVTFDLMEKEKVMDLEMGNFRLKVDGKLTVAIQGKLTTIEGENSDLQVYIGKNKKPKIKILEGQARIKRDKKTVRMTSPGFVSKSAIKKLETSPQRTVTSTSDLEIEKEEILNELAVEVDLPSEQPMLEETIVAAPVFDEAPQKLAELPVAETVQDRNYVWKLYDLYESKELELIEKKRDSGLVDLRTVLIWKTQSPQNVHFQWSSDSQFANRKTFQSATGQIALEQVAIGANYWRLSNDGMKWSAAQKFNFHPKFLKNAEPKVLLSKTKLQWQGKPLHLNVPLKTAAKPLGFVAQASLNPKFTESESKSFWSAKPEVRVSFYRPGNYYYRFRTVTSSQELSEWSKPVQFQVEVPPPPPPPQKMLDLKLANKPAAPKVEIVRAPKQKKSDFSEKLAEMELRKPAAVEKSTLRMDLQKSGDLNEKYNSTRVSAHGFLWTLQSTDQKLSGREAPITTGVGLNGMYWRRNHGLEGSLKSGATGVNQTGQDTTSLKSMEARYHYRVFTGFPFGWSRELQTSVFAGYEKYRNSGSYFSNEYDLMKFGTSLEFPWSRRWSSGGEFVYGAGSDQSHKYEISGKLNYYMNPSWSFGAGYRVHMFEAGSTQTSPQGLLPYREGYTEGFSVLNYHF